MKVKRKITREEAHLTALRWIQEESPNGEPVKFDTYEADRPESPFSIEVARTPQGGLIGICETRYKEGSSFSASYVPPEDTHPTYPFQGSSDCDLMRAATAGAFPFKPSREVTPEEALTPEGARIVLSHFGHTIEEPLSTPTGLFTIRPIQFYEAAVGREITPDNYRTALREIYREEHGKDIDEERILTQSFLYNQAHYFSTFALYELQRTDNFTHLQEVLRLYPSFRLPARWWEPDYEVLKYFPKDFLKRTPEEWCVSGYMCGAFHGASTLTEIRDFTGIPLPLLSGMVDTEKAVKMRVEV